VGNTPGILDGATADMGFTLLLSAARRLVEGDRYARSPAFTTYDPGYMLGREVHGATIGIVGMGRIGLRVATLAQPFDMTILGHDILPINPHLLANLNAHLVSLDALLHASDYVTLHTPLTPQTDHFINRDTLRRMKPTAFLINTARGRIIDEDALLHALTTGTIRGAALDVFETEPPTRTELLTLPNLIATPHIGSQTVEAQEAAALELATRLQQTLQPTHG
jgi:glyoxylate reductase